MVVQHQWLYGSILVGFGASAVAFSMAEMASRSARPDSPIPSSPSLTRCRDPTVGAQYRWSASFAPFAPRFWGLLQGTRHSQYRDHSANTAPGWITIFAWVVNCAGPPAIIANMVTALATFNYETYVPKPWHPLSSCGVSFWYPSYSTSGSGG
jgi:hypothetical protein